VTELRAAEQVSLLVPTKNRPEFVLRLCRYYAQAGFPGRIVIGDSSDDDQAERTLRRLAEFRGRLRIDYGRYWGLTEPKTTHQLLARTETPYAALLPDDDFIVPEAAAACAAFLAAHPDCSVAHGIGAMVIADDGDARGGMGAGPYRLRAISAPRAAARFLEHCERYSVMSFGIHRSAQMRQAYDRVPELREHAFTEMLPTSIAVAQGTVHRIERLYLVRQGHGRRHLNRDLFEWLTHERWRESYLIFRDRVADELARQDRVSLEEALETVKQGFWRMLGSSLTHKWRERYAAVPATPTALREALGRVPAARRLWRAIQARGLGGASRFSLPALLHARSPHAAAFRPVFAAISQSAAQPDAASAVPDAAGAEAAA